MNILITGGAGFIGSNLVNYLLKTGKISGISIDNITVIDNLFLGKKEFIQAAIDQDKIDFYELNLLDFKVLLEVFKKHKFDLVFHLSANSDISYGTKYTDWDLKQETLVTYNVLETMRLTNVKKIIFASTSAIYGETPTKPTPEDYGPLLPISFYGAGKLACEGLISAYSHNYNLQVFIFRFANIAGSNGTHGVLVDFIKKLKTNPLKLEILGNGEQAKPYLYVDDCIEGMLFGYSHPQGQINYYNLACNGATSVNKIAEMIIKTLGLTDVSINYTGGDRGWVGDVPRVRLSPKKLKGLGWTAKYSSDQAVQKAIDSILKS